MLTVMKAYSYLENHAEMVVPMILVLKNQEDLSMLEKKNVQPNICSLEGI